MFTIIQRSVLVGLATILCNCSLVLEDPRPYPEQKADSSIVIELDDAGLGTMAQPLSTKPVLGLSVEAKVGIPALDKRPASTLDWLCDSSLPDYDGFCWFFLFVMD